jgi:hypothetical protein
MAIFRGITAEEESASAIFYALIRRRYENSQHLRPSDHEHKAAVKPFLTALLRLAADAPDAEAAIELRETDAGERVFTRFAFLDDEGKKRHIYPLPPLGGTVTLNGQTEGFDDEISRQLSTLASQAQAETVKRYVAMLKNERNKLLYATDVGILAVRDLQANYFFNVRRTVFRNLIAYLLVDPYPERQGLAQQALDVFLTVVRRTKQAA